jgi:Calcineurin-like phosphoesterase
VVLTVTLVNATGPGFVTVWPAGSSMPVVSNLNADQRGNTVANLASVMVPTSGEISLFTSGGGHLLVDVTGYYAVATGPQRAGRFHTIKAERLVDTRNQPSTGPSASVDVAVLGRAGVPASGVAAVSVNITVTNSRRAGFATVYPTGSLQPNVSSLNVNQAEDTAAGSAIVAPGSAGRLTVFTDTGGDIIVDVIGWYGDRNDPLSTAGLFVPISPTRLRDTRESRPPRFAPAVPTSIQTGLQADAVSANITIVDSADAGFVTTSSIRPFNASVSSVNATRANQTIANHALIAVTDGQFIVQSTMELDLIIDIEGWFVPERTVVAAVGDMACVPNAPRTATECHQGTVSDSILGRPEIAHLLTLGDLQYPTGTLADFQGSYNASYGRLKSMTLPSPGNHEYYTAGAAGYYGYFGAAARGPNGYYSVDIGDSWHVVVLNSNCSIVSCAPGSPQVTWLRNDLETNTRPCTIATWHHPQFSSGFHGNEGAVGILWKTVSDHNVAIVLNGHDHHYERFAPHRSNGATDIVGTRPFVVGTGGVSLYPVVYRQPHSEFVAETFGHLELALRRDAYDWRFVNETGAIVDSGSDVCPSAIAA